MPHRTKIAWADYSTNPLRARLNGDTGWACEKISPACAACYAETINRRFGTKRKYNKAGTSEVEHYLDEKELQHILRFKPNGPFKGGDRPRVFPFDMTDVFGDWVPFELIDRCFAAFAMRPDVDFMVLTKRTERMAEYTSDLQNGRRFLSESLFAEQHGESGQAAYIRWFENRGVLPNVWLGTSTEDQQRADERVRWLKQCPAAVRFISYEPALGPVHFDRVGWLQCPDCWYDRHGGTYDRTPEPCKGDCPQIHWIIAGVESGPKRRHVPLICIRDVRDQCRAAGTAFFCKQLEIDGRVTEDVERFPKDLRIRQWPEAAGVTA